MPLKLTKPVHFGSFGVTSQVFHSTPHSFALVNIKPLLPGHVLVCPHRRVARVSQLSSAEITDLFLTVQRISRMIERVFSASALNIAIQDGKDAGQSVSHVHCHVIPRKGGDLDDRGGNDAIYDMLDGQEGDLGAHQRDLEIEKSSREDHLRGGDRQDFAKPDAERLPRTMAEMEAEAKWLATEMEKEPSS
jgi:bis(5'-adenosyl)-triphosphatase